MAPLKKSRILYNQMIFCDKTKKIAMKLLDLFFEDLETFKKFSEKKYQAISRLAMIGEQF